MYFVLHGEEEFTRSEWLARKLRALVDSDSPVADLNTSVLDGRRVTLGELRHACDVIPFMAETRIVIVRDLLARLARRGEGRPSGTPPEDEPSWKRAFLEELTAYLPELPPHARLFFVESKALPRSHPILRQALKDKEAQKAEVAHFVVPKQGNLPGWIQQRSRAKGGKLDRDAVRLLAALVGPDLRLLDQEIEKLLLYADGQPVTAQDVRRLVTRAREESIFDLVDSLGRRQTDRALTLLHRVLDDGAMPLYVLAMIARQVRILIQVSELRKRGSSERDVADRLSLHPYVVQKAMAQSPNFTLPELVAAHERLLETDRAIKTGEIEDVLALDILVVDLTRKRPISQMTSGIPV